MIKTVVKEDVKLKRKLREGEKSSKDTNKGKKRVSFTEDVDFDAVLDAASVGFVETVSFV